MPLETWLLLEYCDRSHLGAAIAKVCPRVSFNLDIYADMAVVGALCQECCASPQVRPKVSRSCNSGSQRSGALCQA